jgi:hypothetical protein
MQIVDKLILKTKHISPVWGLKSRYHWRSVRSSWCWAPFWGL